MPNRIRRKPPGPAGPDTSTWTAAEQEQHRLKQILEMPIAETALSVRSVNTLEEHDVILVKELLTQTYESLMKMENFGTKTLSEVVDVVKGLGLPVPNWTKPPVRKQVRLRNIKTKNSLTDPWG